MGNTAGFWKRTGAYLVDIVPITIVTFAAFYLFFGFDEVIRLRLDRPSDIEARINFLVLRNHVRDSAFLIWIIYSALTEASSMQGTLGKRLMGLRVTDMQGNRLSAVRSFGRNLFKIISLIPFGLGFFWAAFRKDRRCWHDLAAKTHVTIA